MQRLSFWFIPDFRFRTPVSRLLISDSFFWIPVSGFQTPDSVFRFPLSSPLALRYHSDGVLMFPYRLLHGWEVISCGWLQEYSNKCGRDVRTCCYISPFGFGVTFQFLVFTLEFLSHQVVGLAISDDNDLTIDKQFLRLLFAFC